MKDVEFHLIDGKTLSLNDLRHYQHDRTSHPGKLSKTSQLMVAVAGARILSYTGNIAADPTYLPGVVDGRNVIGDNGSINRLTPLVPVDRITLDVIASEYGLSRRSQSIAQLHHEAANIVWGNKVVPFHYFFTKSAEGCAVIEVLAQTPGACDRVLKADGTLEYVEKHKSVDPKALLATLTAIGESAIPGSNIKIVPGPYLSNESNVALHMLTHAIGLRDRSNGHGITLIHSSGPDMYRYAMKERFKSESQRITLDAARRLGIRSGNLEMVLFPAAGYVLSAAETAQTQATFNHVSELVDLLLNFQAEGEARHHLVLKTARKYKTPIDPDGRVVTAGKDRMIELTATLAREMRQIGLNFKPRELTQWDILGTGSKPTLPKAFETLSAEQVFHLTEILKTVHDKGPKVQVNRRLPSNIFGQL